MKSKGLLHLYWGSGKGKTSAAVGLAVRALGCGNRVVFVQFLKNGTSHELAPLRQLGAEIFWGKTVEKFTFEMSEAEKAALKIEQTEMLRCALLKPCDLMILDEACAAWQLNMVDQDLLRRAVMGRCEDCELVLTGRDPAEWMSKAADYCTEMRCLCHPYAKGIPAREGIEY